MSGPRILVLGATGLVGGQLVNVLDRIGGDCAVRLAARDLDKVTYWRAEGRDAVRIDLDDPATFPDALHGVDRLYLVTGYTVAMLAQSKTIVDAAVTAGVSHIVHQGVFAAPGCTDPHFVWHQLVECYIQASGVAWTHLHPNVFMEQLLSGLKVGPRHLATCWGDRRVGWIAARDIAEVAARVLFDGPGRHAGRDYWLSSKVASGPEVAAIFGEATGQPFRCDTRFPHEAEDMPGAEARYAAGARDFLRQVHDGRMGYIGTHRDDGPAVTGHASITLADWAREHEAELSQDVR